MQFFTTDTFLKRLALLCKKPADGYANCKKDISKEIPESNTFQDLWTKYDPLYRSEDGTFKLVKIRVNNSTTKTGKSGGYRVICVLNNEKEEFSFLFVYPKTGKYKQDTVTEKGIESLLVDYLFERRTGNIKKVDIRNGFMIIEDEDEALGTAAEE